MRLTASLSEILSDLADAALQSLAPAIDRLACLRVCSILAGLNAWCASIACRDGLCVNRLFLSAADSRKTTGCAWASRCATSLSLIASNCLSVS